MALVAQHATHNHFNNNLSFAVRVPISLSVTTPLVTTSTILDEYALLFATALSAPEHATHRHAIEAELATHHHDLVHNVIRELAAELAHSTILKFLANIKCKLTGVSTKGAIEVSIPAYSPRTSSLQGRFHYPPIYRS